MSGARRSAPTAPRIDSEVVRQIRQHARSCSKTEVCGVLIAREIDGVMTITASIAGANASQGGTHVTFTQDTWEHIYKIKDREYPDDRIIGWYHSHPGFGVFLSDHDTFIHKNFFSSAQQVAWVYDPQSDEEGCFGWVGNRLERLPQLLLVDRKGGEGAGETGKPEPAAFGVESDIAGSEASHQAVDSSAAPSSLSRTIGTVLGYLAVFLLGFLMAWYVFPRFVVIPVDPRTRQIIGMPGNSGSQQPGDESRGQNGPAPQPSAGDAKVDNGKPR